MKDFKNVWIFAEAQRGKLSPTAFELLTAGRKLADDLGEKLCAVLLGYQVERFAQDLFARGADVVYVATIKPLKTMWTISMPKPWRE